MKRIKRLRLQTIRQLSLFAALACVYAYSPSLYADIYRYEGPDGELIITTTPLKGLKLLSHIRQSNGPSQPSPQASPKSSVPKATKATAQHFDAYIQEASAAYAIPPAFIKAVIKIESNFNPQAISYAGAMGLMQLMPGTAKSMGVEDPFDPRQNIMGGTKYLRRLSDRYDGDINLVLSGYHAGPGNVEKAGGIPFEKTQAYVRNVYSWYLRYLEDEAKQ